MRVPLPLVSRVADPIIGIFSGLLAYHSYERNNVKPGKTFMELLQRKWDRLGA
ncbi:hypothetical protein BT69DRAFT_1334953 [Atractiella rhizophila]|nr:hypothetical protein BT69DRAFT_1334953 [Atractiella rhizophila]